MVDPILYVNSVMPRLIEIRLRDSMAFLDVFPLPIVPDYFRHGCLVP